MNILVLGAGSIGSVFGGLLCKAGNDVTMVGRKPHMRAISSGHLLIDGIWGEHRIRTLKCYSNLKDAVEHETGGFDVVLLTVKSYDTEPVLHDVRRCFSISPPVVSLQNGLGNVEKLEQIIGKEKTVGGRVIFGVEFIRPAHVRITVEADKTIIGALPQGMEGPFVEHLAQLFTDAGIPTVTTDEIEHYIWGKVLYNCALNGLATIVDAHYGKLLGNAGTRDIMHRIIDEIFMLARSRKVKLDWNSPDQYTRILFDELIPKTFEHHPSMLQDIRQGKKTEIDALNGAVADLGERAGLYLDYNRTIRNLIKAKERL